VARSSALSSRSGRVRRLIHCPLFSDQDQTGIPREAYELLIAKSLYLLMAPESQGGPMAQKPAIAGKKGLSVIIARRPPGDKPLMYA
jgi:hypothetical protein